MLLPSVLFWLLLYLTLVTSGYSLYLNENAASRELSFL
jgi:hypothetical protein